jgi:hypothetical protein
VADTLLAAAFGLGGVALGAYLTVWGQARLARAERDREAQVAARLIFGDLVMARLSLEQTLKSGNDVEADVARHLKLWRDQREKFAAISDLDQFNIVAGAFGQLDRLAPKPDQERSAAHSHARRPPDRLQLLAAVEALELASQVVWRAGGGAVAANSPPDMTAKDQA